MPRADALTALLAGTPRAALPPACTAPMLASPGAMPADAHAWGYEIKWDGYRALARWDGRRLLLCSRNGIDLGPRFPEVMALARALRQPVLLDGEIVALDRAGRAGFSALQTRMPAPGGAAKAGTWDARRWRIAYVIFDVLHCAGRSTIGLGYRARRVLVDALALDGPAWQTPPAHPDGAALLRLAAAHGQEGIIAKRWDGLYLPGRRSRDWQKIKLTRREEFAVGGYRLSDDGRRLASLLLGYHDSPAAARAGVLRYAGKVGTGFSDADRVRLRAQLDAHAIAQPPFADAGTIPSRLVTWSRPRLVVDVAFTEWTHGGTLRHPAFLGLRVDKAVREVVVSRAEGRARRA